MNTRYIENVTRDELKVGDKAVATHVIKESDIVAFAAVSGDINPAHLDTEYANASKFKGVIAHGILGAAFISAVLGTQLPGPGAIYISQSLEFLLPVRIGDEVTVAVAVAEVNGARAVLDTVVYNQDGDRVLAGVAKVLVPKEKVRRPAVKLPNITMPTIGLV